MVLTNEDVRDIVKTLLINNQKTLQGYAIASLYFKTGEYSTALKYVSKYLKIKPNSFLACKLQGDCYEKLNRADDALNSYLKAINSEEKKRNSKRLDVKTSSEEMKKKVLGLKIEVLKSSLTAATSTEENDSTTNNAMDFNAEKIPSPCPTPDMVAFHTDWEAEKLCSEATIKFAIGHFSTLYGSTSSSVFSFQNLLWRIIVMPIRDLGACRTFAIFLSCAGDSESPLWSCDVDVELRLLSVKPNQYPYIQKFRHLFNRGESAWGSAKFMSWNDVVNPDNNYIRNDCVTVEVHVVVLD